MYGSLLDGLALVLSWPALGYMFGGITLGLWLGAVPVLGGVTGLVILLPFTFGMEPAHAFALLLGMYAPVATSDTISSILLGIPGSAGAQATVVDGYPLARQGQASRALGAAYTVSAFGGVFGGIVMAISMPVAMFVILAFGAPEFFLLSVLGLLMVATVSGNYISKGMGAAALGLILSQVGYPIASETPRYWFGMTYLLDGLPLVPLIIGLFGLPEMIELAARNTGIAQVPKDQSGGGGLRQGVRDAIEHRWLALRCSALGVYIGLLPGLGGSIADWVAYGHAFQSAKDKSQFGKGDIRGVIGPEAANNAVAGGSLIPTVALGIPGSGAMAILLGAMIIHGLAPGREMLTTHLDLTFSMVWTLIIANLIGAGVLMLWGSQLAKAAFISGHYVVPGVLLFVFMGSWMWSPELLSWVFLLGAGLLGYVMKEAGWPRPPLVLGFILGPIMEENFVLTYQTYGLMDVLTRPQSIILTAIVIAALLYSVMFISRQRKEQVVHNQTAFGNRNPLVSAPFALLLGGLFVYAFVAAQNWTFLGKLFPYAISLTGLAIIVAVLVRDVWDYRALRGEHATLGAIARSTFVTEGYDRAFFLFLMIAAVVVATPYVGQFAALMLFVAAYLVLWGRFRWWIVGLYTLGAAGLIWLLYVRILHVYLIPPAWG